MRFPEHFTIQDQIESLSIWLCVHSYIYYSLDDTIVSDAIYDNNSKQLVSLITEYPTEHAKSAYYYVTYDFDGSTGYHLQFRLTAAHYDKMITMSLQARQAVIRLWEE